MQRWSFAQLPPSAFVVAIGMVNTGKTSIGRAYVQSQPDPASGIALHAIQNDYDKRYTDFMPSDRVYEDFESFQDLATVLTILRKMDTPPSFVVVDECLWSGFWKYMAIISQICSSLQTE